MSVRVHAVDQANVPPLTMPDRFRHDITYFVTSPGETGAPAHLPPREYWIRREDSQRILEDGVITIVSPLDSTKQTEIEITVEQEMWIAWLVKHSIQHVRLE